MMSQFADDKREALRCEIRRIERRAPDFGEAAAHRRGRLPERTPFGVEAVDALLGGGLERGAVHEIVPAGPGGEGAASAFALILLLRAAGSVRPVVWVTQDSCAGEAGALYAPGLAQWGLAPERLVVVRAAGARDGLWATEEALRCRGLGAVVLEPWGAPRELDLVAVRRLLLAAEGSGVTAFVLRSAGAPGRVAIPAATRWRVGAAPSPAVLAQDDRADAPVDAPGDPAFDLDLLRNRLGPTGSWRLLYDLATREFSDAPLDLPHVSPSSSRHGGDGRVRPAAVSIDRLSVSAGRAPGAARRLAARAG